jgi:hypothetical protein
MLDVLSVLTVVKELAEYSKFHTPSISFVKLWSLRAFLAKNVTHSSRQDTTTQSFTKVKMELTLYSRQAANQL